MFYLLPGLWQSYLLWRPTHHQRCSPIYIYLKTCSINAEPFLLFSKFSIAGLQTSLYPRPASLPSHETNLVYVASRNPRKQVTREKTVIFKLTPRHQHLGSEVQFMLQANLYLFHRQFCNDESQMCIVTNMHVVREITVIILPMFSFFLLPFSIQIKSLKIHFKRIQVQWLDFFVALASSDHLEFK